MVLGYIKKEVFGVVCKFLAEWGPKNPDIRIFAEKS
jgi:hypothetical protein